MKITRYGQSCLVIENGASRIATDPGTFFTTSHAASELGDVAAVFYTHQHPDHFDEAILEELVAKGAKLYGPSDLAEHHSEITAIQSDDELEVGGFKIKAVDLPHCSVGAAPRPYNLGYVIDGNLLVPGDSSDSAGIEVEVLAVPILGPDISPKDAIDQINATKAKVAIPIHYDMFGATPDAFEQWCQWMGAPHTDIRILVDGASTEV